MNIDEMKNRISLVLKDPILQQGFEIICKENAELQDKLKNLASVAEVRLANWQKYEKENAELKEALKNDKVCKCSHYLNFKDLEKENTKLKSEKGCESCTKFAEVQLTKATEIIKKLKALYLSPVVTKDDVKRQNEILAEAEQFLKDIEVEK